MRPFLFFLSVLVFCGSAGRVLAAPGYLDFDNLPETGFSCEGKVIGGYYADIETGCQMFHVCTVGQKGEIMDIKFLCLNGTVFDQETRVCERVDEVDCSKTEGFYDLNLELYGAHGFGILEEDSDDDDVDHRPMTIQASSTTTTTSTSTTTTTTTTTTTPRPTQSFPSSSPSAVALLAIHNSFSGVRPVAGELATELQPPTPPTYTLRQQHHPHGVAHTFFSNTPRPFQFFGRALQPAKTTSASVVVVSSSSMTQSVSRVLKTTTPEPPAQSPTEPPSNLGEDYDAIKSFYEDVPREVKKHSLSVSMSSSSSITPIFASHHHHNPIGRPKRQLRQSRRRGNNRAIDRVSTEAPETTTAAPTTTTTTTAQPLPETSFKCTDKTPGGYYADTEVDCRIFHICVLGRHNKINDYKFVCGVGTKFDQQSRTCIAEELVRCNQAPKLYHLNDHFLPPKDETRIAGVAGFESKKIRAKRQAGGPPNYSLSTLPASSNKFKCPDEDGLYADPASSCQAYHQCTSRQHSLHICPYKSVFNEALGVCDQWENVDCNLYSDAFHESTRTKRAAPSTCEESSHPAGTPIADEASDCRSYHICVYRTEAAGQLVQLRLKCPAGKVMHPKLKRCVKGNTCQDAIRQKTFPAKKSTHKKEQFTMRK